MPMPWERDWGGGQSSAPVQVVPPGPAYPYIGPKAAAEAEGAGLDNQTKAMNLKYGPALKQATLDQAQASMITAKAKQAELQNQLDEQQRSRQAVLNQEYSLAQMAAKADDTLKASEHPVLGNTAAGGWNDVMKRLPFSGGSNANELSTTMESLRLGLAALGAQDRKALSGPGGGTQFAVRNLPEFLSMGASGGPLVADNKPSVVHDNLLRAQNILRNDMALQMGLDPTKVDARAIPGPALEPSPRGRAALQAWLAQRGGVRPSGPSAPKMGEVRRGFRYKGGDPAQQSSWVKAQ